MDAGEHLTIDQVRREYGIDLRTGTAMMQPFLRAGSHRGGPIYETEVARLQELFADQLAQPVGPVSHALPAWWFTLLAVGFLAFLVFRP